MRESGERKYGARERAAKTNFMKISLAIRCCGAHRSPDGIKKNDQRRMSRGIARCEWIGSGPKRCQAEWIARSEGSLKFGKVWSRMRLGAVGVATLKMQIRANDGGMASRLRARMQRVLRRRAQQRWLEACKAVALIRSSRRDRNLVQRRCRRGVASGVPGDTHMVIVHGATRREAFAMAVERLQTT